MQKIEALQSQLDEAERRLEKGMAIVPLALQPLLQKTCEVTVRSIRTQFDFKMNFIRNIQLPIQFLHHVSLRFFILIVT